MNSNIVCVKVLKEKLMMDKKNLGEHKAEENKGGNTADRVEVPENLGRLQNFPISFFAIIMGLSGFTIAWEKAAHLMQIPVFFDSLFAWGTLLVFLVISGLYIKKILFYPEAVTAELKHPVKLSFFPAVSISLLLISVVMMNRAETLSHVSWFFGVLFHFVLFLYVLNSWMHHEHYQTAHISPAWFIPAVGNVLVPITGMHFGYVETSWFFFSIGIIFWVILFSIFFNRILFHNPMPKHLVPTLFILIAPPAVGFIAYVKLNGGLDNFAHILYYIALFLTLSLFTQIKQFTSLPFFLSWWAYSFPISAITIASFLMYSLTKNIMFASIGGILLAILSGIIALLIFKTYKAITMKKVCVESH